MLQIISGKFYKSENRFRHAGKGIMFSNYHWIGPIETSVATLEPVDIHADVAAYVMSYTNQLEKPPDGKAVLIRCGDDEIQSQFRLLAGFGLCAYVSAFRSEVAEHCRHLSIGGGRAVSGSFVPRLFQESIRGSVDEVQAFVEFVERVIGLKRKAYASVISAIQVVQDALQVLQYNVDLAYSMLVYSIESLGQQWQLFTPTWEDYEERVRRPLDALLTEVPASTAEDIRSALLTNSHLKLRKRFESFVVSNVSDSFFRDEARQIPRALRRSELERALRNAYAIRSRYVHMLEPLLEHLKVPSFSDGEVFRWDGEPYLTLRGLFRLVRHVVRNFVYGQEQVASEDYPWRSELPGVITCRLAPQYWLGNAKSFTPKDAPWRLFGLLEQIVGAMTRREPINNLKPLMQEYEKALASANKRQGLAMLATYWLYNGLVPPEGRIEHWEEFLAAQEQLRKECCVEMLLAHMVLGLEVPWPAKQCLEALSEYSSRRFGKNAVEIPHCLEVALLAACANVAFRDGEGDEARGLLQRAILDSSGNANVQEVLAHAISNGTPVDIETLIQSWAKPSVREERGLVS